MFLAKDKSQDEVDHHGAQERDTENRRSEAVIKSALASQPDAFGAPMEGEQSVDHGKHGDDGEDASADDADAVTEVQQAHGQTTQDDGEVKPAQEGSLVGEKDFGLDAGREGNALA